MTLKEKLDAIKAIKAEYQDALVKANAMCPKGDADITLFQLRQSVIAKARRTHDDKLAALLPHMVAVGRE